MSLRSLQSAFSDQEQRKKMKELTNTSKQTKIKRIIRMNLVVVVPIISLIAMAAILLQNALTTQRDVKNARNDVEFALSVSAIVSALQVERGTSALYMSSNSANIGEVARVRDVRASTDRALRMIPADTAILLRGDNHTRPLVEIVHELRDDVNGQRIVLREMVDRYTNLDHSLLDYSVAVVDLPGKGMPWRVVVAINTLSRASDSIGIQRALGSTFYVTCSFDRATAEWFAALETAYQTYLTISFFYYEDGRRFYEDQLARSGNSLSIKINSMKGVINDNDYAEECSGFSQSKRENDATYWFSTLTLYIDILREVRESAGRDIVRILDRVSGDAAQEVTIYTSVTVLVSLASLGLGVLYANSVNKMTEDIKAFSDKVKELIKSHHACAVKYLQ